MKAAVNARRATLGQGPLDALQLLERARDGLKRVNLDDSFLQRGVNEGLFRRREKTQRIAANVFCCNRILCLLDEADSGLDIDALKVVGDVVNDMRSPDRSFLLITHYRRLLDHIPPDHVHILSARVKSSPAAVWNWPKNSSAAAIAALRRDQSNAIERSK